MLVASLHFSVIRDQHNRSRKVNYDGFIEQYDFSNVNLPSTSNDICHFQKQNIGVAINALQYIPAKKDEAANVVPIYHPPHKKVINRDLATILLVGDHWLPVLSLNRLLSVQNDTGVRDNVAFCYRCLANKYLPDRLLRNM